MFSSLIPGDVEFGCTVVWMAIVVGVVVDVIVGFDVVGM